ncbi:YgzB family protein [Brevibacillus brevis]|uniref:YgzB family protein n=1 Tax=Brevibacillus brevis TaxID=1393 RepID=A0ABY9TC09_BREBE|nr:YgzB family protein [Brevibacillus brevis]WNC17648.1 YgzB family protein [Brevibacillus brevis]
MKKTERLSKIKRMRTWGNWSMVIGILLMYTGYAFFAGYLDFIPLLGTLLKGSHIFMTLLLIIGFILTMGSTVMFMISGMVSTSAPQVQCPSCQKVTKMLGKEDACMFCGQPLRLEDGQPQQNQT